MTATVEQPATALALKKPLEEPTVVTRAYHFSKYYLTTGNVTDMKKIALNVVLLYITLPRHCAVRRSPGAAGRTTHLGTPSWACLRGEEASVAWSVPGPS